MRVTWTVSILEFRMSVRAVTFQGSRDALRVGKILCLGRNYREHAREMKADVPKVPVVFLKPATAIITSDEDIIIPPISGEMHYETEMVVVIGEDGKNIPASRAMHHVAGYGVGLDMTLARDMKRFPNLPLNRVVPSTLILHMARGGARMNQDLIVPPEVSLSLRASVRSTD